MALAVWQKTITDAAGNVLANASVKIWAEATGTLASLFSDRDGNTGEMNPVTADANGFVRVYLAGGAYKIVATSGSVSQTLRHEPVGLLGEKDLVTGDDISISSEVQGDVLYHDGTRWTRLAAGTAGEALKTGGEDADPEWGEKGLASVQTFTSSGTWTRPSGVTRVLVEVIGGGGGGAGGFATSGVGSGGGGGAYAAKLIDVSAISSATITIGAGGSGGADGGNGSAGGDSSWDDDTNTVTAGGGGAGSASASKGGQGGAATGGDVNYSGNAGDCASGTTNEGGGGGGASGAGGGRTQDNMAGTNAFGADSDSPGGGGGGASRSGGSGGTGGDGADGLVVVWEYE